MNEAYRTGGEWLALSNVISTEAYLTDVLAYLAQNDHQIMLRSEQKASYSDVMDCGSTEELAEELRRRWARAFVDDGGPSKWISRLDRMGARFPEGITKPMEEAWGVRHLLVHAAGHLTREFLRRHPDFRGLAGDRLSIDGSWLRESVRATYVFAERTDEFIERRVEAIHAQNDSQTELVLKSGF